MPVQVSTTASRASRQLGTGAENEARVLKYESAKSRSICGVGGVTQPEEANSAAVLGATA